MWTVSQVECRYEVCMKRGNKSRKFREIVYAHVFLCMPTSSALYCYVNVRKQQKCCGRTRQSIKKKKYRFNRYFLSFSCNKLMCPCKSETHVSNYYKITVSLQINFYYCSRWMTISTIMPLEIVIVIGRYIVI